MSLFHPRAINKKLHGVGEVPAAHSAILTSWATNLGKGIYERETQSDGEFIQRILIDLLGYVGSSAGNEWTVAKNQPVGSGNVDVALGRFAANGEHEILAPFELKGARTRDLDAVMSGRHKSPVQQAWEYAMDAKGATWVLVSNFREIRMYAVGYGRKDYESFDLANISSAENYHRMMLLLSAGNLLSGNTLKLLKESDAVEKEITKELYAEYKETRSHLIAEIISQNKSVPAAKAVQLAQTILDRVLFVAFSEDKGMLSRDSLKQTYYARNAYSPKPVWENFIGLFNAVDVGNDQLRIPGYNGGLFASNHEINALTISDELCRRFVDLGEYDYESEVSVNILGHIFEQSISDLEEIKKQLDPAYSDQQEVGSKRRTDGIFYTPPFVTHNIVEQTVGKWLADRKQELGFDKAKPLDETDYASIKIIDRGKSKGQVVFNANVKKHISLWSAYRDRLSAIRVVDPACGSGAFLNEVFDFLYREGQNINRVLETLHGGQINLFRWDTHILANNIFGVDINRESVEITKLSLWLKTANRREKLSYLDDNIKAGNSLIKDKDVAGELAFDWKLEFSSIMESGGFDIVVGNPPYVDSEAMAKAWARERDYITRNFEQTRGNWDLYVAFIELGCNLLSDTGYLSYITPDKWISKDFGAELRKRVLPGIVSILPVGRDVFENALVDSIVTTISANRVDNIQILKIRSGEIVVAKEVEKVGLNGEDGFDQILSSHYDLLRKLESVGKRRIKDIALTENACATSDTYVLGEIIEDAGSTHGFDRALHYKIANTGTLDRFSFRWGARPMRYLKRDYIYPIVAKSAFKDRLGATYQRRAASQKLMIKGLTLLDAALDAEGIFVPGKSTLVISSDDPMALKLLLGVINSRIASFYVKEKYASASYNGGVNFTPDMLNAIPVPENIDAERIVYSVDRILSAQETIRASTSVVHAAIRASGAHAKLRQKFDRWYELSSATFIQELMSQGINLSVREKAEWIEIFESNKAKVSGSVASSNAEEKAIDRIMFDAFGLSVSERDQVCA